ncbi:hypothetical protein BTO06_08950 [Tenacibaculum sp. SZ-18]|uniref:hypothetical protein n=1 Tax=Tenacibaculum sp. SZ-18 TaxID=754423 RepID=UPI000C2D1551|nr:hypothetical protein [Tenacibaculum sp. SZ-18]AUC15257.1 hypothetical protein BTO06_08950 [Tenacibaculum sp. SZ-18]
MRKFVLLLTAFILTSFSVNASESSLTTETYYNYGNSYIFTERGVEFAVYPDGQFDFYLNQPRNGVNVNFNSPGINISFNSGYNYDAFVQYDDYGAVVQIEDVPVFYDHYGRIVQAGDVYIRYNRWGRVSRVGGLFVNYNSYGNFLNCNGYINSSNRSYIYRPYHRFFVLPVVDRCVVWNSPYRRFYSPYRFSYAVYRNHYHNGYYRRSYRNRTYYRPGARINNFDRGRRVAHARNVRFQSRNVRRTMYQRNDRNYRKINKNRVGVTRSNTRSANRDRSVTKSSKIVSRDRGRGATKNINREITDTRIRNKSTLENNSNNRSTNYIKPTKNKSSRNLRVTNKRNSSKNRPASITKRVQNSSYNSRVISGVRSNRSKGKTSKSRVAKNKS